MAYESAKYCDQAVVHVFANASHWVPIEYANEVIEKVETFMRGSQNSAVLE